MSKSGTIRLAAVFGCVAALVVAASFQSAEARPNYGAEFGKKYPNVKEAATAKCGVCHIGKPADKKWNDYGTAVGKALGEKNVKAAADVVKALEKAEDEKSGTEGKTFGDLLKDGKLPGKE